MARGTRRLTIADIEAQGRNSATPIYALNSSAESEIGLAGEILLGIPNANGGKAYPLRIPQTWLPICLTTHIPRAQLLDAVEFRQALDKKLIVLIDPADAAKIERQDGARVERERLAAQQNHMRRASAARTISDSGAEITRVDGGESEEQRNQEPSLSMASSAEMGVHSDESGITPSFEMFAERLAEESDVAATNTLRGRGKFSRKELKFLLTVLGVDTHPKTRKKVKAVLAGKKNAG